MRGYANEAPCFTLDRFSADQTRAFFKCDYYRVSPKMVFRRLHEKQLVGAPVFFIQVREVVNDTGLPDLQIDDEKEEVSFDWKDMLDQLLGEEHVFNTILSQRLGWHLDPGEDRPDLLETHRRLARRSRLQRECRAKYRSNILVCTSLEHNFLTNGPSYGARDLLWERWAFRNPFGLCHCSNLALKKRF